MTASHGTYTKIQLLNLLIMYNEKEKYLFFSFALRIVKDRAWMYYSLIR